MERVYYGIKEVSEMTGLSFATLRYWEKVIPSLKPKKNAGMTRFYTPEDIELIRQIKYLRDEQHLSIEGINKRLQADKSGISRQQYVSEQLHKLRDELVELRRLL